MRIAVSADLRPLLRLGVARLDSIALPADDGAALWNDITAACEQLRAAHEGATVGQIGDVRETRALYRSIGLDPTKTRPSSEALLRRVIKGKDLYRIHPLVDLFNLLSLQHQLSVGLYDLSKIDGDEITVRLGGDGWGFEGIRRGRINVMGRLCVTDASGPFGSPTADSARTSIEGPVDSALAVFYQPATGDPARMARTLAHTAHLAETHLGARCSVIETPCS